MYAYTVPHHSADSNGFYQGTSKMTPLIKVYIYRYAWTS